MSTGVKETVIQFGEGGFLRGFVDYFFHKLQEKGLYDGKIVVVQPIEKGMCQMLSDQNCEYNLFLRGIDNGQVVNEHTHVTSISRSPIRLASVIQTGTGGLPVRGPNTRIPETQGQAP